MEELFLEKTSIIRRNLEELERILKVKIEVAGKTITISGDALDEYEASIVLEALSFGFVMKKALLIKNEEIQFIKIPIKSITKRKDLKTVRARVIGKEGKTKRTIEDISDCSLVINNNEVGVIGNAESINKAKTALQSLIRGSKESNVYNFLERMNAAKKDINKYYKK